MATTLTSAEVLRELNLSRSTFYYLLKNNLVEVPTTPTGRYIWDEKVIDSLKDRIHSMTTEEEIEEPE